MGSQIQKFSRSTHVLSTTLMTIEFGYWRIRGLIAPCHMLCEYVELPYKTTFYDVKQKPDGSYDGSSWFGIKHTQPMILPNIPWLKDNEESVQMSETMAILKYLAKKTGKALPKTLAEWSLADNLEQYLIDFRGSFIKVHYNYGMDEDVWLGKKAGAQNWVTNPVGSAVKGLDTFEKVLSGKDWFISDEPTYIDFYAWEIIDHHVCRKPSFLNKHENVKAWHQRFAKLE